MNVTIKTIPHKKQRYETVGDWLWKKGNLEIRVSDLGDWRMEMAIAYHEMFEALDCKRWNIHQEEVDEFDTAWQEHDQLTEPGDDPKAPYFQSHQMANIPERLLAMALGLNWQEYEKRVDRLFHVEPSMDLEED